MGLRSSWNANRVNVVTYKLPSGQVRVSKHQSRLLAQEVARAKPRDKHEADRLFRQALKRMKGEG